MHPARDRAGATLQSCAVLVQSGLRGLQRAQFGCRIYFRNDIAAVDFLHRPNVQRQDLSGCLGSDAEQPRRHDLAASQHALLDNLSSDRRGEIARTLSRPHHEVSREQAECTTSTATPDFSRFAVQAGMTVGCPENRWRNVSVLKMFRNENVTELLAPPEMA